MTPTGSLESTDSKRPRPSPAPPRIAATPPARCAKSASTTARHARVGTLLAGINGQFLVGLSFAEGYLAWYESSNLGNGSAGAYRYRPGRAYRYAEGPPFLSGFAWTGEGTWQARASYGQLQDDCDDGRTTTVEQCTLVRADDLDWEIVAADRVR